MIKRSLKRQKEYKLFEQAMNEFSDLAEIVLKGLKPFSSHGQMGTCAEPCPTCQVKNVYWNVKNRVTEFKK